MKKKLFVEFMTWNVVHSIVIGIATLVVIPVWDLFLGEPKKKENTPA